MSSDTRFQFQAIGHGPPMDLTDEGYDNRHLTRSDFETMAAGYPGKNLLFNHDPEKVIGKVVSAFVDPATNNFVVTNEIDLTHPSGVQAMKDIRAGVFKNISLGYSAEYGLGKNGAITVFNKTPCEVSLVGDAERPESIITHIQPKSERERNFDQFFMQIEKEINSKKEPYNQHVPTTSPKNAHLMSQQTAATQSTPPVSQAPAASQAPTTSQTPAASQTPATVQQSTPAAQPPKSEKMELIQNPATTPVISGDYLKDLDDESRQRAIRLLTEDNIRRKEELRKKKQEDDEYIRNIAENLGLAWENIREAAKKEAGSRAEELEPYVKAFTQRLLMPSTNPLEEREKNDMLKFGKIMSLSYGQTATVQKMLDETVKNSQMQAKEIGDLKSQVKTKDEMIFEQQARINNLLRDATGGGSSYPNETRFHSPAPAMPVFVNMQPTSAPPQQSAPPVAMPSFSGKFAVTTQTPSYLNPNVAETNLPKIDPANPFSAGLFGDQAFTQLMERHRNTSYNTIKSNVDNYFNALNNMG